MLFGQLANTIHPGHAAVCILPNQLTDIHKALEDDRSPAEDTEVEYAIIPDHGSGAAHAVFPLADGEQDRTFCVVRIQPGGTVGPVVANKPFPVYLLPRW